MENIPGSMYVAYSVNKGQELSICIREKETEKTSNIKQEEEQDNEQTKNK